MLKHEEASRSGEGREGRGIGPTVGRQLIALLALAFVVTLGVVVGTRMSSDAIAVLVGVIAGVAASIPCALLLLAVTRRREQEDDAPSYGARYDAARYDEPNYRQAPPVIVVTPGTQWPADVLHPHSAPYGGATYGYPGLQPSAAMQPGQRRHFRVMGYDEEDDAAPAVEGEIEGTSWYR